MFTDLSQSEMSAVIRCKGGNHQLALQSSLSVQARPSCPSDMHCSVTGVTLTVLRKTSWPCKKRSVPKQHPAVADACLTDDMLSQVMQLMVHANTKHNFIMEYSCLRVRT